METDLFGIKTNKEFLLNILKNNNFKKGDVTTSFLKEFEQDQTNLSKDEDFKAFYIGACLEYELKRDSFLNKSLVVSDELRNWTSSNNLPFFVHYKSGDSDFNLSVLPKPFDLGTYEVTQIFEDSKSVDNKKQENKLELKIIELNNFRARVEVDKTVYRVPFYFPELDKFPSLYLNFEGKDFCFINLWTKLNSISEKEDDGIILSPMHGILSEVLVGKGDEVKKGQIVAIVEAMKMQNELRSKVNGRIKGIYQTKGKQVSIDEKLIEIEVDEN